MKKVKFTVYAFRCRVGQRGTTVDPRPFVYSYLGFYGDDVTRPPSGSNGVLEGYHDGGHKHGQFVAVRRQHSRPEQLDGRTHHFGVLKIHLRQAGDALARHLRSATIV